MMESWKQVVGYEGIYEVSNRGSVRSVDRVSSSGSRLKGVTLTQFKTPHGYVRVGMCKLGKTRTVLVHPLVLEAFVGPRPGGSDCRHLNDKPDDNRLENLRWGSRSQNTYDSVRNGSHINARKTHCKRGHPFAGNNLYVVAKTGKRQCKTCASEAQKVRINNRKRKRRGLQIA